METLQVAGRADVKQQIGSYLVSFCFSEWFQGGIKVYRNDQDVTEAIFDTDQFVPATLENLNKVYARIKNLECVHVAIGVNAFGIGVTKETALKEMRKHCAKQHRNHYQIFEVWDTNASVNGISGNIHSKVEPKLVETSLK